ncbi:MAG: pilus assembly protein, partial [Rhizobiales bacterium]|nr:pilus assembly protein [Hyphomicrobiales bacterium]
MPINFLARFRRDKRANVAVIFALTIVPILGGVGCAVDYSMATRLRSKLQAAADAASVGAIGKNGPAYVAAGSANDGTIPVGGPDALKIFTANMANESGYTLNSSTATVVKAGSTLTSTVSFSATINTTFMRALGTNAMTVTGTSVSTATMPVFIDFYLLLDNSPSMGVAATPADVAKMVNNTSDQCAFACHDLNDSNNYYNLAKSLNVTTRIDVVRSAAQSLMDTAASTQVFNNQFRMAIYTFGASASTAGLTTIAPLTSSLSTAKSQAGSIDLMTVNGQNQNNDMDTNFTTIMPQINAAIPTPGAGTSSAPQKFLFFVSDGVADEANPACLKPTTNGTRCQSPINPALCTAIKARGVQIAVLYTTYLSLPSNAWYNQWIAPFNTGPYGPS